MKSNLYFLLERTKFFISVIKEVIGEKVISKSRKDKAVEENLRMVLEYQIFMIGILGQEKSGPASCIKLQFEAFLRGAWLDRCANKEEIENAIDRKLYPNRDILINSLIRDEIFYKADICPFRSDLYASKYDCWFVLCNLQYKNSDIEPSYSEDDLIKLIDLSNWIVLLSAYRLMHLFNLHDDGLIGGVYYGLH